ncbi:RHS repeat-associated core domain-containing protein [Streptomyces sp. ICN903]|uniref:RHS repeat-associated core domain-containing protein n=1 Tax=Streptomyces sp. ICN903 TaxID=2964654 RepID=UPI0035B136DB
MPQPYRFTGTYLDPTGLCKMGARYYDPHLGRFTQPDPSGQETNPYLYATGDPINRTDPTGLTSFSEALDVGEKIFSAAAGCLAGIGAAGETGILTAVTGFFGAPGGLAAGALACGVGAGAGLIGAEIISYG